MRLLEGLAMLLLAQSAGELLVRAFALPLPGPVLGLALALAALALPATRAFVAARLGVAADALLAHLSLLFVPLGVGVISHLSVLREHAVSLALVIVVATAAGLAASAWVLDRLWRDDAGAEAGP